MLARMACCRVVSGIFWQNVRLLEAIPVFYRDKNKLSPSARQPPCRRIFISYLKIKLPHNPAVFYTLHGK
jgi:hypothetical protein